MQLFAGFWKSGVLKWDFYEDDELERLAGELVIPEEWPRKTWKPSNTNLLVLDKYEKTLSDEYWSRWEKYEIEEAKKDYGSWIDSTALRKKLVEVGYPINSHVEWILKYIKEGADIGCQGEGRWPTSKPNCPSALEHGAALGDMIQTWIRDKICWGPLKWEELPWDVSLAPLKAVPKPNGRIRPVLDLSGR